MTQNSILSWLPFAARNDPFVMAILKECRIHDQSFDETMIVLVRSLFEDRQKLIAHRVEVRVQRAAVESQMAPKPTRDIADSDGFTTKFAQCGEVATIDTPLVDEQAAMLEWFKK